MAIDMPVASIPAIIMLMAISVRCVVPFQNSADNGTLDMSTLELVSKANTSGIVRVAKTRKEIIYKQEL